MFTGMYESKESDENNYCGRCDVYTRDGVNEHGLCPVCASMLTCYYCENYFKRDDLRFENGKAYCNGCWGGTVKCSICKNRVEHNELNSAYIEKGKNVCDRCFRSTFAECNQCASIVKQVDIGKDVICRKCFEKSMASETDGRKKKRKFNPVIKKKQIKK